MQANNYYNSQLNDKIPELYQLAYEKYLKDIDLQIQDLGILQDMSDRQYSRYRDTMSDWQNDRQFAYGVYHDAVNQSNWQNNYDYNSMWDNINFNNNNYWANKEYTTNQQDKDLNNSRYDQETAREEVWKYIELGITPSADLIAKAGMSESDVALAVQAVKAQSASKGKSGGGSGGSGGSGTGAYTSDDTKTPVVNPSDDTINSYLTEQVNNGTLTKDEAADLYENASSLTSANWELYDDGGINWGWGLDNNAQVKITGENGRGEYWKISDLYAELKKSMGEDEAKKWLINLQKDLGI